MWWVGQFVSHGQMRVAGVPIFQGLSCAERTGAGLRAICPLVDEAR